MNFKQIMAAVAVLGLAAAFISNLVFVWLPPEMSFVFGSFAFFLLLPFVSMAQGEPWVKVDRIVGRLMRVVFLVVVAVYAVVSVQDMLSGIAFDSFSHTSYGLRHSFVEARNVLIGHVVITAAIALVFGTMVVDRRHDKLLEEIDF